MNLVDEERMGYFRSTARSSDEVEQENIVLQEQLDELAERMEVIEKELARVEWVFTDTLDVLKEPYVVAKNNLIKPYIERKMQFLEFKIETNKRFMQQQKQGTGQLEAEGKSGQVTRTIAKPPPLSRQAGTEAAMSPASCTTASHEPQSSGVKLHAWRQGVLPFASECRDLMRQVLPADVFSATDVDSLLRMQNYKLSSELANRLMTKRCLWILCLNDLEIQSIDDSLLSGVYSTKGQNLDLVETAAVYGIIPEDFLSPLTSSEVRLDWAHRIQRKLRHMLKEKEGGLLADYRIRCPAYFTLPTESPPSTPVDVWMDSKRKAATEESEQQATAIVSRVSFGSTASPPQPRPAKSPAAPAPRHQAPAAAAGSSSSGDTPVASLSGAAARVRRRSLFNSSRTRGPPAHVIRNSKVETQPELTPTPPPHRANLETIAAPLSLKKTKVLRHADI